MYEPRIISYDPEHFPQQLKQLYSEGWVLVQIHSDRVYLHKEIKKTREQKKVDQTKEYLEFREKFPSKNGIYDPRFVDKYNKLVTLGLHNEIMEAIDKYKTECEVLNRPFANPETWINQKRWLQPFKATKIKEDEWQNELFEGLDAETIKLVKQKIQDRRAEHKPCEKSNIIQIIEYYQSKLFTN